uniref:Uncharacterized protein n=1 Tax=Panagrellus redivivus TaxID=6233 RepID=A0A7E4ZSV5_PANRE
MLQGRRSGRTPRLGRPIRRALRRSGHSTSRRTMSSVLAWSPPSVITAPQSPMTVDSLQETASNCLDLLSSLSRSVSITATQSYHNNPSDLLSCSQSLRSTFLRPSSTCYYEPSVFNGMQSTSIQEPKACKKRNSASSLRHGFVGKRSTSMKKR